MNRLFITADLHGSLSSWLTIKELILPGDGLVVAGDLFDTRYGNFANPDFQPDTLKNEILRLNCPFFYVYGNCDVPNYFPGHGHTLEFQALGKKIFLHHGHRPSDHSKDTCLVIQGHTHCPALGKKQGQVFMNPGSITCPRAGLPGYGIMDKSSVGLFDLKSGNCMVSLEI